MSRRRAAFGSHRRSEVATRVMTAVALAAVWAGGVLAQTVPAITLNPLSHRGTASAVLTPRRPASDGRIVGLRAALRTSLDAVRGRGGAAGMTPEQQRAFAALRASTEGRVQVRLRAETGTPMEIRGPRLEGAAAAAPGVDDEATARAFLRANQALLRLDDPGRELTLHARTRDELGRRHLRFTQRCGDIPAWPSALTVHLDPAGNVDRMNGAFVATPRGVALTPVVDADQAVAVARAAVADGSGGDASAPEFIVYTPLDRPPRLAWKLDLTVSIAARWIVVVDALDASVLATFDAIMDQNVEGSGIDVFGQTQELNTWREGDTFFLVDTSKAMFDPTSDPPAPDSTRGAIIVLDAQNREPDNDGRLALFHVTSSNANSWSVADGVSAAFGLSQTYDYYRQRHNRDSLDGEGGTMLGVVRFSQNFKNAFWNGTAMVFGDGDPYAGALDIVAHELTHGVTEKSANLVYQNQPGALNEAFSDAFGEAVEQRTNGDNDWLTGAQLGRPQRNLMDPASLPICAGCPAYPSKMSEFFGPNDPFLDRFQNRDNGGVHINSSIINRAFYLLAEGLNGAIGIEAAADIFYRALTTHLVANSQFIDARLAAIAAAEELFGQGAAQAQKVAEAFDTVEIFDGNVTPPPPPFPGVQGPDATLFLYMEPISQSLFLARREAGDDPAGIQLSVDSVAPERPAVAGDGSFAVFVSADNDVCLVSTGADELLCLGFSGQVASVAMSPDATRFGFVLLEGGTPSDLITVIDVATEEAAQFPLRSPAVDGGGLNAVLYANTMDFTADGRFIVYDALNQIDVGGSQVRMWSIYALDLETDTTLTLIPPTRGFDIAFPALSQTSDNFVTFDAFDQEQRVSTVLAGDLTTGELVPIATVARGYGVPGFTGDDTAIVYSQADAAVPTGFSLVRQPLATDRITPNGPPSLWLADGDFGVIYRRGPFTGPQPTATPTTLATRTLTRTATRTPSPTHTRPLATVTPTRTGTRPIASPTATVAVSPTPTTRLVPTPTPSSPASPSHSPTPRPTRDDRGCAGDCDDSGIVAINELVLGVNIALGRALPAQCPAFDTNGSDTVSINELVAAVNRALQGCG